MRGFSLVELLVALTVCALLSGAIAAVTPQARAAFEATPEALDLQQRERTVADVLTRALRSSAVLVAMRADGTMGKRGAAVTLLDLDEEDERFHAIQVITIAGPGRGVLELAQSGPSGSLRLKAGATCPSTGDVCGFSKGTAVAIVDVDGRVDVFTVSSVNKSARTLSPSHALSGAYPAGAAVFEVAANTYYLEEQADASFTLVRETAAGAVQPMVDFVTALSFAEWRSSGQLTRVDISVRLDARSVVPSRRVPDRIRELSVTLRNPS
jgi:prepilin-type N-terminal cleavage/methylation domain-containing protein